jgi:threonine/homoserine/homoserine lactone efflux protein
MTFFVSWLTVLPISLIVVITPSPDLVLRLCSSLAFSRRARVHTRMNNERSFSDR